MESSQNGRKCILLIVQLNSNRFREYIYGTVVSDVVLKWTFAIFV